MTESLQQRLATQLENRPQGRAVMFYDPKGQPTWSTYEQFLGRAQAYAGRLQEAGLQPGDCCVLVLPSEEFCAVALTGVLMAGAVPLLVAPPILQASEAHSALHDILDSVLARAQPRLMIGETSLAEMQAELSERHSAVRFLYEADFAGAQATSASPVLRQPDDVVAMQLTSGTTGAPRICVWKQSNFLAALDGMTAAMAMTRDDVCLNWTPLYHDMGLVNNFLHCLSSGVPLVMLNPHDFVRSPATWLRSLHETGATVTWSPNFGFALAAQRISDEQMNGVRLDHVRGFWNAAERIHYQTMTAFYERFADYGVTMKALKTNFGCAENIGGATFSDAHGHFRVEYVDLHWLQEKRIAQTVSPLEGDENTAVIVSAGRPYPGMEVAVLGDDGAPLPEGHVGAVALRTPSRMEKYLADPEATAHAIQNGYLLTGDLGYVRDGELFWTGRSRELIAIRGKKMDPSDFESLLLRIDGLRHGNFAVFGVDEAKQGTQRIVVVAEVRDGTQRSKSEIAGEIRMLSMQRLGINVSDVVLVRSRTLTKTSSGKRRHRFFHDLYQRGELEPFLWEGASAQKVESAP